MVSQWELRTILPFPPVSHIIQNFWPAYYQLATCSHAGIFLGLFDSEDGGDMFL
jgi:hypothetical protein